MDTVVAHRSRAIRDQIVDREVRRLELSQRAKREAADAASPPEPRDRRQGAS
jgi:hypothetical protein